MALWRSRWFGAPLVLLLGCNKPDQAPEGPSDASRPVVPAVPSASQPVASVYADSSSEPEPEAVAIQHVLIAYRGAKSAPRTVRRSRAEASRLCQEVVARARAGADFSQLVEQYSDDPGSRHNRGNLGKRRRDELVPRFADAAFRLKEGEVSDVVETEFGFHVIKRNQ